MDSGVVVGHFHSDFPSIFSFIVELMPQIVLTTSWHNDLSQIDPSFTNEVRFLVVVEDGAFELVVVRRLVNSKSKLLIPRQC